ncbi:MAG: gamma-glutamyl-gamma-aminobutyrate hydrolase family protein [Patescibacteria group bacterium]
MEIIGDFNTSLKKALSEIDNNWENYRGLVVCGTHNPRDTEMMILKIKEAREKNIPFLGICFGFQLMLVEWMRNCGFQTANTAEVEPSATPKVIVQLPEMRVGIRSVFWRGKEFLMSHWHRYGFARKHTNYFEKDWELSWTDGILEVAKLKGHTYFLGTQGHPEYDSSKDNKHTLLVEFLVLCKKLNVE